MKNKNRFQGSIHKKDYFEGWYYKQVSKKKETISVIFGISTADRDPHSFIQVIENITGSSHYIRYEIKEFAVHENPYYIAIGKNKFYEDKMVLHIEKKEIALTGTISFTERTPLTKTSYRPTIMGPFSYLKNMQCNHGIVSLHHTLHGVLSLNGRKINFEKGTGYIEKDYGTSFPKEYFWTSSTHASKPKSSFVLAIAHIPLGPIEFKGIICTLLYEQKQYFFTSYYFCKIKKFKKEKNKITIHLKQGIYILKLLITYRDSSILLAPKKGSMTDKIRESLDATIHLTLLKRKDILIEDTFTSAGLELV